MSEAEGILNSSIDIFTNFFPKVLENVKQEINNGIGWMNFLLIPGLEDQINLT